MLKKLINEAVIDVEIKIDTPLVVKSGQQNVLDPSLPDDQMLRSVKDGRPQEVIPGSSLKGAFRSRAERLLRGQGYEIDDPFTSSRKYLKLSEDGMEAYKASCNISQFFGSLGMRGRVQFADAFPVNPDEVKTGVRNGVGIDRITGGARRGALFNLEVVEEGTFSTQIKMENFELWQLSLILWLVKDLNEGHIRLGSAASRGFGKVKAEVSNVVIRTFKNVGEEAPITGFLHGENRVADATAESVAWTPEIVGAVFERGGLDNWIGADGLLKNIRLPKLPI